MTPVFHLVPLAILTAMAGTIDASGAGQPPQDAASIADPADDRQTPEPPAERTFTDEVVVTANRLEQMARDVPVSVTVLTADEIARSSAQTVDELLRQIPGFSLLRQSSSHGSHPTTRSAALRGLGGLTNSRTLVLLNGVPMNEPFAGVVYWSRVPLEDVERIEVVKGGGSGIWGNLALGGVINIITSTARPGERAVDLTAEAGSRGTGRVHAATRIARGRFRTAATASYYRTDGYMTVHPDRRGDVDRPIRDVNATVGARLEYQPSAGTVWSLGGGYYGEDQDWGTPLSVTRIDAGYLHGGGIVDTAGGGRWQVTGFLNRQGGANVSPSVAPDRQSETIAADQFDMPATAAGSSVQWSRPIGARQLLTAGADAQVIDTTVSERFNFVAGQLTRTRELGGRQAFGGVFVEDIVQVTPAWRLVVAARVDRWRAYDGRRLETDIASQAVLRDETFPDRTAWRVSPSAGVVHHVSERISLKASVYRAFRAPTPSELSRPFRARGNVVTESNPRLDPERLTGIEGGVDAFLAAGLRTRITGFWDRLQDPVTQVTIDTAETGRTIPPCGFVPAGGVCRQRQNLGWLQSRGVESAIEYRRSPRWTLSAHWLFNPSRVVAAPDQPQLVGAFNKQSPVHQVTVTAAYDDPRAVRVSALGRFVGRRFEDDLNSLPLDGFFVADLRVSRPVSSKAELYLSIQNLFDRTVQTTRASDGTIGIGAPRLVNAGLRVRF